MTQAVNWRSLSELKNDEHRFVCLEISRYGNRWIVMAWCEFSDRCCLWLDVSGLPSFSPAYRFAANWLDSGGYKFRASL